MTRYLEIKPGSISETIKRLSDDYQAIFKKELEKTGKGIGSMTPDEKKAFFNKIDKMHNAKNEEIKPKKPEDSKTVMVVKPNAPAGQEKVIRVPKEKLADYKSKGYVEAESYIPEAKKVKEEELTAGQKKLPPALQKAIEKKQKNEEVETVEEAAGPDRLTNLNDKITKLQVNLSKLDMSKPENKTKEAIMKADLTTAKLRLQDVIQKKNTETKKESVNEAKKTYKSIKKSVKKEQDKEVNSKRTLTDKPLTKVDVDPKIEN